MMRGAFILLAMIDERWPPDGGYRSTIHRARADEPGFVIEVNFRRANLWESMLLEDSDLDRAPEDIIAEIERIIAARPVTP